MEFLPELKQDNELLAAPIAEHVGTLFSEQTGTIHRTKYDSGLLLDYLKRPGRGIGGSLVLRLSQLNDDQAYGSEAITVAAATEVLNAGILIVDDWMDHSAIRKGQPTIHKQYERFGDEHAAACQAVQLGMLAIYSSSLMANSAPERVRYNLMSGAMKVAAGCMLESRIPLDPYLQTPENVRKTYEGKTGYYSVLSPIRSGLLLAGASDEAVEAFTDFGLTMGVAFQLQDDLMGVFGNPEVTGKPNTDDIREGVYTYLYNCAEMYMPADDFAVLEDLHGKADITNKEAQTYAELLRKHGIEELVTGNALVLLSRARYYLDAAWDESWNDKPREYLDSLIDFLTTKLVS